MKIHKYWIYIVTNPNKTVLYIGVNNNLRLRLEQHYKDRGNKKYIYGKTLLL